MVLIAPQFSPSGSSDPPFRHHGSNCHGYGAKAAETPSGFSSRAPEARTDTLHDWSTTGWRCHRTARLGGGLPWLAFTPSLRKIVHSSLLHAIGR